IRDLFAFGDPAGSADIGLQYVDRPLGEERAKTPTGELRLAPGDRNTKRGLHLFVALQVLGRHGLLEPGNTELLDLPAEADCAGRVIGVIGVDHDCDLIPNGAPYLSAKSDVVVDAEAELELDRRKAFIRALSRLVAQIRHRVAAA